jgi:hypothetical protein
MIVHRPSHRGRPDECVERDNQRRPRLTVTLPDSAALDNLARSLTAQLTWYAGDCSEFLVAREGIEPPTRGFSVRCSTN